MAKIYGYNSPKEMTEIITDIANQLYVNPDDRYRLMEILQEKGSIENFEFKGKGKDGKELWISNNTRAIYGQNGKIEVCEGTEIDITERKQAEADRERLKFQLLQSQKMEAVGTLAGGIAHDFNNLLQAIYGYTQIMLRDKSVSEHNYSNLVGIQKTGERAAQLVRQLLIFSREVELERKPVDLNIEVKGACEILQRTIPKMVEIKLHPGDGLWKINADHVQIEQVILNLGSNAADAMPDGGKLIIETENAVLEKEQAQSYLGATPGNYVLLTISDTGQGMDKKTLEHIFEPFYTTKEIGKGTGLGLASVYGTVRSHGGYIICYSEVDQGTTFKIYLPATELPKTDKEKETAAATPAKGGNETILLVDDEEAIRDLTQEALMDFGYKVMTASTGEEALEIYSAKSFDIDLVVMDLGMPGMGGHRCLQELVQINPVVKVIITSGYSINGQVKKSMEAGAVGYVGKPYRLADLLNAIREVLEE